MSGAVIIGVGPGIGRSAALRLAREGMPITLIARTVANAERTAADVAALGVPVMMRAADSTDEVALRAALTAASDNFGVPDVVVYNAAMIQADTVGELPASAHLAAWAVNVGGALTAAAHVAPEMARRGTGSFIITGGMPEPKREYVSLSLGKAGVRTLVDLLAMEYGASGVHVASVTIDGPVAPGTAFDPDEIAKHYWTLHTQTPDQWQQEILHSDRPLAGEGN